MVEIWARAPRRGRQCWSGRVLATPIPSAEFLGPSASTPVTAAVQQSLISDSGKSEFCVPETLGRDFPSTVRRLGSIR